MTVAVNGEPHEVAPGATVSELLSLLGIKPERVAVLVNDEVVPAPSRAAVELHPGDRVEVLTFAAGG